MNNRRDLEHVLIHYAHTNLAQELTAEIRLLKLLSTLTLACNMEKMMEMTLADK